MKPHITTVIRATVLSMALLSNVAWAGIIYVPEVEVSSTHAQGSKGGARYSSDANQYIGCDKRYSNAGGLYARCEAYDKDGNYFNCYTYDPNMIALLQTDTDFSYLSFSAASHDGSVRI